MELFILHGNGQVGISQKISQIKKNFDPLSIIEISAKEQNLEEILIKVSTPQLFSHKRLLILEDFDKSDLKSLPNDPSLMIILRFTKQLSTTSTILKEGQKSNAKIINFEEKDEQLIFPFLDALSEKNSKAFKLFEELYKKYGGQYLLTMILYMLRRLILKPKKTLPSFVIQKIEKQKRNFSKEKIKKLYREILETDFKVKNGLLDEKIGLTMILEKTLNI